MLLPFVREAFADAEKTASFARLVSNLKTALQQLEGGGRDGAGRTRVSGLTPTAKLLHFALLHRALQRPLLLLVANNRAAEQILPVLRAFCELTGAAEAASVVALPVYDVLPFENLSPHPEIQETRATTLWKIVTGRASLVVAPIASAAMCLREQEYYADLARVVRKGEAIDAERLVEHLNTVGYSAVDVVEMPGDYALRGGILDVYSPETDRPVRIEFFGDEVESMRSFDPGSQRSQTPRDEVVLLPLTETPVSEQTLAAIHTRLSGKRVAGSEEILERATASGGVSVFPGWEFYAPIAGLRSTIFDLLPRAVAFVDEPTSVNQEIEAWWEKINDAHERSNIGSLVRPEELYIPPPDLTARLEKLPGGSVEQLGITHAGAEEEEIAFSSQPTPRFHGSMPAAVEEVRKLVAENQQIVFALPSLGEVERMAEILGEYNIAYRLGSRGQKSAGTYADEATQYFSDEQAGAVLLVKAFVPDGVRLPEAHLSVFGALDLFDDSEVVASHSEGRKSKVSAFLSDFRDLAVGDYVVHVEHGIGQYLGLKEISQSEGEPPLEFMVLEYADAAKLYVPLTRLDLVQKYRSAEGGKPVLNHLGSAAWGKTKARVKKAMADMADELLKLYAERKSAQGIAFSADGQWQREFEDAFEYNETEDQLQATADIKCDMESQQPMDRLLCGDVGYGKTEVAMRAAFKAAGDSKQVAVLAPTTILAFQHFETFKHRFQPFPVRVEMLSRFRSPKELKEVVADVAAGKVDIAIGTHRLLSQDVQFKDLGLVIVDEEQRFGVKHKERLKQLRKAVDVIAMSATPIPRTLHMSLLGLRDMSVIETPPKDRLSINTVVAPFQPELIKSALELELNRGGQVYYVHNRVDSIWARAAMIQELVSQARIGVGHGQMA